MDKEQALESVNEIKELMERSSKFISLSGLSAIMAGIYALVGVCVAQCIEEAELPLVDTVWDTVAVAAFVFVAAAATGVLLSYYKSKRTGQRFFSRLTYRTWWHFALPLLAGGVLCLSLLLRQEYDALASAMLLFYGLALVNVAKFTYSSVAWLGYGFLLLGGVDCCWAGHSYLLWAMGFGGLHILYGFLFYLYYERSRGNR